MLLDLQGAWLAPPEYDLVCLLRDSYVELPEPEIAQHLAAIRPALPDAPAPEEFRAPLRSADALAQGQGPRALPLRGAHARRLALPALRAGDGPLPARCGRGAQRRATRGWRRWPS